MKGRGVRSLGYEELHRVSQSASNAKDRFVLIDAVGVEKSLKTESRPLERNSNLSLKDLLQGIALGHRDNDTVQSLANRLIRLSKQIDKKTQLPSWKIDFIPNCEEAETWDQVFSICIRYERDVLNQRFDSWLRGFVNKCKMDRKRGMYQQIITDNKIQEVLAGYQEYKEENPAIGMDFLEPKMFEFLLHKFKQGNQRVVQLIRSAVVGITPEFT